MYSSLPTQSHDWSTEIAKVKQRFDQEFKQEAFDLPAEVEAMPIFREWISHNHGEDYLSILGISGF
jgi:hypothetical protein